MGWDYDAGDHGWLRPSTAPTAAPAIAYALGLQCSSRGKLRAAGVREASPPPLGTPGTGMFCNRLDASTPVTVVMAARRRSDWRDNPTGGRPSWAPARHQVHAAIPSPGPPKEYASYAEPQPHDPLEHLRRSPLDVGCLRIITANCGGLRSTPGRSRASLLTSSTQRPTSPTCERPVFNLLHPGS